MTQEGNTNETLSAWWNTISFEGKEQFELRENGELFLKAANGNKERQIAAFTADSAAPAFKALLEKYPEVSGKVAELQKEWDAAADKLKLTGKVERMAEYLKHTNAAGDFSSLQQVVQGMEKMVHELTEQHYIAKIKLAETAEKLADSEDWKDTTQKFRDLADEWKNTGILDKNRSDELWNRVEAAKNKFHERKRAHHDDIEKELLQNLDLKMELVEKAEALAAKDNWKEATEVFKTLMEEWKKIGRTVHDKNESLWNRFIAAKNTFYDRKKNHFETIQQEQEANSLLKEALIEKADALKESTDWNVTSQRYAELMDEWKQIGKVPIERADELWNRFNAAKEVFFSAKRHHFETMKVTLDDNYAQKMGLLKRAEGLQHSRHWREATVELNELLDEWKKIGPVPREHSNVIWERFIAARKSFFARKDEDREKRIEHAERQKSVRAQQAHNFYHKLEREIDEEREKLADFKNGLENITPSRKARELEEHLQKLITQTEHKIHHKLEKLEEIKKQLEESDAPEQQEEVAKD